MSSARVYVLLRLMKNQTYSVVVTGKQEQPKEIN
jgi:hypothetical protein